jgi:hypothetical protein
LESKLNFNGFGLKGGIIFFYNKAIKFTFLNQGWIIIAAIPPSDPSLSLGDLHNRPLRRCLSSYDNGIFSGNVNSSFNIDSYISDVSLE